MTEVSLSTCGRVGQVGPWRGSVLCVSPLRIQIGSVIGEEVDKKGKIVVPIYIWDIQARLKEKEVILRLPYEMVPPPTPYQRV